MDGGTLSVMERSNSPVYILSITPSRTSRTCCHWITSTWFLFQSRATLGESNHLTSKCSALMLMIVSDYNLSPRTGIFALATEITRQIPTATDDVTHETIHPSVLRQKQILPQLETNINNNQSLVTGLMAPEDDLRTHWPYVPGAHPPTDIKTTEFAQKPEDAMHKSLINMVVAKGTELGQKAVQELSQTEIMKNASGQPVYEKSWLARHADETPFGGLVHHWVDKK